MSFSFSLQRSDSLKINGFTIIELLIVIVVIGILAAITLVAYNGVQNKANVAVLNSDLENVAKKIGADNATTGAYPISLAAGNDGQGIAGTNGTTLAYINAGNSFCVTGVRGTNIYHVGSNETLSSGGCPITNLIDNPSLEANATNWEKHTALNGSRVNINGEWVYQATRNSTSAAAVYIDRSAPIAVTPGGVYTASAWVTSSVATSLSIQIRQGNSSTGTIPGAVTSIPINTPTRVTVSGTVPLNVPTVHVAILLATGSSAIGDSITVDKVMLTQGDTAYQYADGDTDGWSWSSTVDNSPSSGPALL